MRVGSVEKNFLKFFEDGVNSPPGVWSFVVKGGGEWYEGVKFCVWCEGEGCHFPTPRGRVGGKTKFPA